MSAIQGSSPYKKTRKFSGTGLTAFPSNFSPASGFKWKVLGAYVVLHTSVTTGTRRVFALQNLNNNNLEGSVLSDTGNFTTVSTSTAASLAQTNEGNSNETTSQVTDVYITEFDSISISGILLFGDTFDYYVVIEETN